jgi:hypothetical protein
MNFIPETPKSSVKVPYYDDVTREAGWQGQTTTKNLERLKSEIVESINRLGGMVMRFQRGKFQIETQTREGFRIHYIIETNNGASIPGRIDIAALPVRAGNRSSLNTRLDKSLRMSLFMLRTALDGTWFLQQLSPGYAPLMPWMLAEGEKTITQLWQESSVMQNLLPPGETDFVEGAYK